ncbi:hypothetical protein NDN08_003479 [Rhodosorus marinus]|uniref:Protein kinase domain-containing protein n=1 Tax=Rhodosorus marinus TaxID=101924 RepID=A0AAV8UWM0_9RHOD|nr:hypothetical protein NDN08_003479 [Rhodosorus marinus]
MPTAMELEERKRRKEKIRREFFQAPLEGNRYQLVSLIGEGAYGIVCQADDRANNRRVAVKRILRCLESPPMAVRILRELKFLRLLNKHENIIKVLDVLIPGDRDKFNDTFVVFELMPTDLSRLLRSRTVLNAEHIKYFMFQLLRGLHFLHSSRVFHRDLKPNNILVNEKCELRICDFGLARAAFENDPDLVFWTDYVATRWYRAPELIMAHFTSYSTAIDIWSVGCIFAEILGGGRPLFPGKNGYHQLELIAEITGRPTQAAIDKLRNTQAKAYMESLAPKPRKPLEVLFKDADPLALNLLSWLLNFDPDERPTALGALNHPYFNEFRQLGYGAEGHPLDMTEFAFERQKLTAEAMRQEFLKEICIYHPNEAEGIAGGIHGGLQRTSQVDRLGDAMDAEMDNRDYRASETLPPHRLEEINNVRAYA